MLSDSICTVSVTELVGHRIQDTRKASVCYPDVSYVRYVSSRFGQSALQLTLQAADMLQNSLSPFFFNKKKAVSPISVSWCLSGSLGK